jgi:hypothetical protein
MTGESKIVSDMLQYTLYLESVFACLANTLNNASSVRL